MSYEKDITFGYTPNDERDVPWNEIKKYIDAVVTGVRAFGGPSGKSFVPKSIEAGSIVVTAAGDVVGPLVAMFETTTPTPTQIEAMKPLQEFNSRGSVWLEHGDKSRLKMAPHVAPLEPLPDFRTLETLRGTVVRVGGKAHQVVLDFQFDGRLTCTGESDRLHIARGLGAHYHQLVDVTGYGVRDGDSNRLLEFEIVSFEPAPTRNPNWLKELRAAASPAIQPRELMFGLRGRDVFSNDDP